MRIDLSIQAAARGKPGPGGTAPSVSYGRQPGYDAGTGGDFFVDAIGGLDANDGFSPGSAFATVGKAVSAALASPGPQTIRVIGDGVRYRERVSAVWTSGGCNALTLAAYGSDKPWITGAEIVQGFAACDAADADIVGTNFAQIHKATMPTSALSHSQFWRMMVSEDSVPLELAQLRETNPIPPFFIDATAPMFDANDHPDLAIATNPTWYASIDHPSQLGGYTDAQLTGTVAAMHAYPNKTGYIQVSSVSGGVLSLASNSLRPNAGTQGAYSLLNIIPAIRQGGWSYRDDGDGTITVFVWPNDPASLAAGIEISARKDAIYLYRGDNRAFTIDGLGFEMCSSSDSDFSSGPIFLTGSVKPVNTPTTIRQCHVRNFDGIGAGITLKFLDDVTMEHTTLEAGRAFGAQVTPPSSEGLTNYRWRNLLASDLSQTGFRCFGLRDSVVSDVKAVRTSAGGHANAINFYQGCDRLAIIGFVGSIGPAERLYAGYATNQASSRILLLHCTFTMAEDGRAYVDQTSSGNVLPFAGGDLAMLNCWVPHEPDLVTGGTPGIVVGKSSPQTDWTVYNCIAPAIAESGGTVTRRNNLLTWAGASTGHASEDVDAYGGVYKNADAGDFSARNGGPLRSLSGFDASGVITRWEGWFPGVDFRRDQLGRVWDPASPGQGPFGEDWAG